MTKKDVKKAAKEQVSKVLNQAREESLKLLENAKMYVKLPTSAKEIPLDKLLPLLKKVGLATQEELNELREKIEKLEAGLADCKAGKQPGAENIQATDS